MLNSLGRIIVLIVALIMTVSCTSSGTVFLYDGEPGVSSMAKAVNDIPLWKDADAANRNTGRDTSDITSLKCFAKPKASAAVKSETGNALEVRVTAGCTGFVNKNFVHNER
jgi:hypothetical protein